ncbi:transmembrane protein 131-like isoform X2 [Liolophura sinensis]|uniref:transmembrane protein 131-like isoform X2 n=1 Tax=Liolophura sinensis TaxID=3198878 RepID=UPI003158BC36
MAGIDGYRKENMALEILHFILLFNSFPHITSLVDAVESQSQAFIQTDNHLTFIVGDGNGIPLEVKPGQRFEDITRPDGSSSNSAILLDPPFLDFQQQPVGMPRMEQVTVQNLDNKNNLYLLSISGSTVHFHCSFFQDKTVPPGGNTTFDVVFLARQVGNVENTLFIHTSQGSYKYQVFGVGVPNPYRLRPYLGAKVPVNSSFSPLIHMHNPHSSTLQVLEMYSSDGDLHLELPTGEKEAPQYLWEIPPFETKPVMRANFVGRTENNHTAFIRIKTNKERDSELLILPVEVEVTAAPGIYSPLEMLDFGILRTLDEPKTVKLNLGNSGNKAIHITSVLLSPANEAVSVDFRPVRLPPDMMRFTTVAQITFKASKAISPKQWSGKIIVKSKSNHFKLVTPYQANVLHGSLVYNITDTYFFSHLALINQTRKLNFTNTFNFSVVLYNATLPPEVLMYFTILNFSAPVVLRPQETAIPFLLKFHPNATQIHMNTKLIIHTNASTFVIPIIVYNGALQIIPHRPEKFKGQLDFGTMGVEEKRSMTFTLRNDNPVPVYLREFSSNMNGTVVEFLGMEKGNGTALSKEYNVSEVETDPLIIKPYHFAVFSVNVVAPKYEGAFAAEVIMSTQFDDLFIPMTLRTAEGSLNAIPEKLLFDKTYPGKIPFKVLKIHSSFENYMEVRQVTFQPPDSRFYYEPPGPNPVQLEPQEDTVIGRIYFDAKRQCKEDCYVGLPTSTAGHQWLLGLTLDKEVADTDQYLYTRLQQKWERLQLSQHSTANVTIELDTNEVRGFLFSAQSHLHWPSLVRKCKIKFPLTQLGNMSVSDFLVENPGDVPVLTQILPLSLYPNPQTVLDMMSAKLTPDQADFIEMEDLDIFRLPDLEQYNPSDQNPVPGFRKHIENSLGVKPHPQSITTILSPGMKVRVRVGFQPTDEVSRTSLILIRNNLTIVDMVVVQGQGGRGEMRFSNRKPGSQSPLMFEMTEKHLKNCDSSGKKAGKTMPLFTVRRTFTIRNTGELPFYVHGFAINDSPCEGYGFKVLECQGFDLQPNTSRKIDIAFTPDFTMSKIRRSLSIYTSLGPAANYTLQATVPPHTLAKCSAALPRPNWEPILYYSTVCITGFLLFCILVAGYFEADRIFVADILKRKLRISSASQPFDKNKVFDLKAVAGLPTPKLQPTPPEPKLSPPNHTPPTIQKPVLCLANGHVEHREKKSWFGASLMSSLRKTLFSGKKSRDSKAAIHRQSPQCDRKAALTSPGSLKPSAAIPSRHSVTDELTHNDRSQPNASKSRKSKGVKRNQNDLNYVVESLPSASGGGNTDKKPGSKDTSAYPGRKLEEPIIVNNSKTDTDKENIRHEKQVKTSNNNKKVDKNLYMDVDRISVPEWQKDDFIVPPVKTETGKGRRRSSSKYLDRDQIKVRHLREAFDDKDDTSSTTTESSGADIEDKSTSARDSTPEPTVPKPKKQKTKSKANKERSSVHSNEDAALNNDDDFVMSSKSKLHKKIKVNPKDAFGGNIHLPSTLELPYSLEVKKGAPENERPETTLISAADLRRNAKIKSRPRGTQPLTLTVDTPTIADQAQDSPPPVWDFPKPTFSTDLSELAQQTESFAQKHRISTSSPVTNGFSPDGLSSSSRSSSYSSIVSSSSTNDLANTKPKMHKPTSDVKKTNNMYLPFGENSHPGAVGSKTPSANPLSPNLANVRNTWSMNPGNPASPGSLFGLHTIPESQQRPVGTVDTTDMEAFAVPANVNYANSEAAYAFGGAFDPPQQTMMQQLLADRRRRVRQHQLKLLQEDWPGFDIPPVRSESLWDPQYNPRDQVWSTATDAEPANLQPTSTLWSTLTNSANHGWNSLSSSLSSIWNSGNPNPGECSPADLHAEENPFLATNPGEMENAGMNGSPREETGQTFDPFNTMGNIWGPNTGTNGGPWGFMPRPEDTQQQ